MSLVDYASSDEEDAGAGENHEGRGEPRVQINFVSQQQQKQHPSPSPRPDSVPQSKTSTSLLNRKAGNASSSTPQMEKLPDASLLLNSPMSSQILNTTDHSSRVAAAMAENASRKREASGLASSYIRGKVPKGSLHHLKGIPDTGGCQLVPPQLSGRSNVVTEDIGKLFIKRNA
ncbi:hypothetical protein Nepgr_006935 [Nepenthes gracilis]|uniref:Uncharacterized protein n=1 Tax=Nepenthes gracilis TaxID=150966 RepID=A0AAD3S617_NEPGR|nr:hypothetical protein Nepgr_006935 [Nepenthes gracilis]